QVAAEPGGAVGLAAGEGDVQVGRVRGDAVDLGDVQVAVEVRPDRVAGRVAGPPDAAVGADEQPAGVVQRQGVDARVRAVAVGVERDVGPGAAAIGGPQDRLPVGGAADLP